MMQAFGPLANQQQRLVATAYDPMSVAPTAIGASRKRPFIRRPATSARGAVHVILRIRHDRRKKVPVWFAGSDDRRLMALAASGRTGPACERFERARSRPTPLWFLTTEPNAVVGPVHPEAMPVILDAGGGRDLDDGTLG